MRTTKEKAISQAASELRLSEQNVRMVVDTYERTRTRLNRSKPKHVGGGWYEVTDPAGTTHKVQGKAAAEKLHGGGS